MQCRVFWCSMHGICTRQYPRDTVEKAMLRALPRAVGHSAAERVA